MQETGQMGGVAKFRYNRATAKLMPYDGWRDHAA